MENRKREPAMPEDTNKPVFDPQDHPWITMPKQSDDDSLDETVRFSLDEIRIA